MQVELVRQGEVARDIVMRLQFAHPAMACTPALAMLLYCIYKCCNTLLPESAFATDWAPTTLCQQLIHPISRVLLQVAEFLECMIQVLVH